MVPEKGQDLGKKTREAKLISLDRDGNGVPDKVRERPGGRVTDRFAALRPIGLSAEIVATAPISSTP
jgi:hypothetical protein